MRFGRRNLAVNDVYGAVALGSERIVVGDDDEGLSHLVAETEEELVEFFLVL